MVRYDDCYSSFPWLSVSAINCKTIGSYFRIVDTVCKPWFSYTKYIKWVLSIRDLKSCNIEVIPRAFHASTVVSDFLWISLSEDGSWVVGELALRFDSGEFVRSGEWSCVLDWGWQAELEGSYLGQTCNWLLCHVGNYWYRVCSLDVLLVLFSIRAFLSLRRRDSVCLCTLRSCLAWSKFQVCQQVCVCSQELKQIREHMLVLLYVVYSGFVIFTKPSAVMDWLFRDFRVKWLDNLFSSL